MEHCKINNCPISNEKYEWDKISNFNKRNKRILTSDLSRRWKKFPIPFVIKKDVNRSAVLLGINNWEKTTCLTFEEKEELPFDSSGILFVFGSG